MDISAPRSIEMHRKQSALVLQPSTKSASRRKPLRISARYAIRTFLLRCDTFSRGISHVEFVPFSISSTLVLLCSTAPKLQDFGLWIEVDSEGTVRG